MREEIFPLIPTANLILFSVVSIAALAALHSVIIAFKDRFDKFNPSTIDTFIMQYASFGGYLWILFVISTILILCLNFIYPSDIAFEGIFLEDIIKQIILLILFIGWTLPLIISIYFYRLHSGRS